jgi:class 3 adenylate cyclase/tetratricopeptide (TPR) repeat protein
MLVCLGCGQSNPDGARFCMACASLLPGAEPAPHGARKTVTVVFCDVTGSTMMAERLDPESVREVMSRFFREMRSVLEFHGGTVEKFIGDAVMAVFGIPLLHEDDAIRAVRAAAGMRDALPPMSQDIQSRWGVELRARIGVNTGEVVVGDPAAGQTLVVGDAVNVAARLEQAAAPGEVLIGPATYALVRDLVEVEQTEALELKGKRAPLAAFRLIGVEPGSQPAARPEPRLVGRREELATLRSSFERCVSERRCELMTILGSAGEGKSRLAHEFAGALGGLALVLSARCLPYGDGITFWPVAEIVKQACAITDDDSRDQARAKIDATVEGAEDGSLIAERVAAVTGLASTVAGLQETFWAIRRFLEHLARDRPLVVSVDDLQWAEPTFLDLVEYLAGWGHDVAILLLCLARPDLMDTRPTWGSGTANASTLSLGPLGDEESAELITAILGGDRLEERTTERIAEAAGGNPLFLEEMLRMLEDDGLLLRQDGGWVATEDLSEVDVPASIHALLGARLDRLTAEERAVIRCASVMGRVFWWGAVAELAPESIRPEAGSYLQTLVRKDLIRPEHSSFAGEDAFRFHHILIQEAAYRGTPKEIRADLHERFASWIERSAGERAEELEEVIGYHLEQAHRYRVELGATGAQSAELGLRGARILAAAGRRAFARGDMSGAADLLGRASALFSEAHPERRTILPDLAEALSESGDLARAETVLSQAIELAEREEDQGLRANAVILQLLVLESTDPKQRSDAVKELESLMLVLRDLGDDLGLARAHRLLGDIHWVHSRFAAADEAFERGLDHARRAAAPWEEAWILGQYTGSGIFGPVPTSEAARRCEAVLSGSKGMGVVEARALRALAAIRAMEGHFDVARELAMRARSILQELGLRLRAAFVSQTFAYIEMLAGDYDAAEREYRSGYDAIVEMGEQGFLSTISAELAHALVAQGKLDEAEVLTQLAEDVGAEDDLATQVLWRSARARVLASRGAAQAVSLAYEAVTLADETDDLNMRADTLLDLGEVLRADGRDGDAADAFAQALELYEVKGNVVSAQDARRRLASVDIPL